MGVGGREFRPVLEREESGQASQRKQRLRVKKASRMRMCPRQNSGAKLSCASDVTGAW